MSRQVDDSADQKELGAESARGPQRDGPQKPDKTHQHISHLLKAADRRVLETGSNEWRDKW
ncbi:hypothetical protein N7466_005258 [Penicillium verhagenii]|uniref:uncharacterized protein n=1 Tax=Penicillium verhagenii TaxID=1562060 RepID=UPI0025454CE9|nr:uncharacterized protein N7466_005258 [Penicillium verhagenii]KAJ5935711.1 hypothetical protein N7466_005258 [Penicillium verhagenii]